MFASFDGDHRVRKKKVQLGGRSRARASVQDRQGTLANARLKREERQRARRERQAATTIGAFVRRRLARQAEAKSVRAVWISENGRHGEKLLQRSREGEGVERERLLSSTRQLVFFADRRSKDDALRLAALCEVACNDPGLADLWLGEPGLREGRLPNLCHLLVCTSVATLTHLRDLKAGEEEGGERGERGDAGAFSLEWVLTALHRFLFTYLDLGDERSGAAANAAISRTLGFVVREEGLYEGLASLLEGSREAAAGAPAGVEARESGDGSIALLAKQLISKGLRNGHCHCQLVDLLAVEGAFGDGGALLDVSEVFWKGLMETTRAFGVPLQERLARRQEPLQGGGSPPPFTTMLRNVLTLSRNRLSESTADLAPFLRLVDTLLTASLRGLTAGEEGQALEAAAGNLLPDMMDLASEETSMTVSILAENVDMWNGLSRSILPSGPGAAMSQAELEGTVALVSLFSKLITHCGDSQPLVVMLTSLAFKVDLFEKIWFYAQAHLDPTSISEADQDQIGKVVIVMCTVHVLRLQIINDQEFYQKSTALMPASELNKVVVYLKTHVSGLIERRQLTLEDLEDERCAFWYERMVFRKAVDHLDKLHEQNGRYRLIDDASFHLRISADEAFMKDLETGGRAKLLCTRCPFFIPFHDRVKIFRHCLERDRSDYYSQLPPQVRMNPFLSARTVTIRRKYILEDGYSKLDNLGQALKCIVRIQFVNEYGEDEAGVDGGGLFKDFLENLITTAFDTQYGFFCANPENKLYPHPSSSSVAAEHLNYFRFFGRMIGKAIYEGILVDVPFADFFLRKVRGKTNGFDDLQSLDKELYDNLCFLRGYEGRVEDLGLCFQVEQNNFGRVEGVELMPGGKDVAVTNANVVRYIHLMANFKLNVQLKTQFAAFMQGLQDLVEPEWIALFNDAELQELISGSEKGLDLADLKLHTVYGSGYSLEHPVIQLFWQVVAGFTAQEQALVLKFVTACSRPPLLGFRYLEPQFCIQKAGSGGGDEEEGDRGSDRGNDSMNNDGGNGNGAKQSRLPTAATCMNILKLPPYATKAEMEEKIRYAINAGAGFELS